MTIKLLTDWPYKRADNAGYHHIPAGSVVSVFDAGTEAAMIVAKVAEASALAATWTPPSEAPIYTGLTAEAAAAVQAAIVRGGFTPPLADVLYVPSTGVVPACHVYRASDTAYTE